MTERDLTVCIISYFFTPTHPGYGTRCPLMIGEILLKLGYKVKVITAMPPSLRHQAGKRYKRRLFSTEQASHNMTLYRIWTPDIREESIPRKLILYLWFLFLSHIGLLFIGKIDTIVRIGPYPPLIVFPEFLFSKIKKAPLLIHLGDLWPDVLFTFMRIRSMLTKQMIIIVTLLSYRLASGIVTITSSIKNGIIHYGIDESKMFAIELGVDCDTFRPIDNVPSPVPLLGQDRFIVMYSGNFGPAYDFNTLLQAAKQVGEINSDLLFVIRGSGALESFIRTKISELGLSNVLVLGTVDSIRELVQILNMADVLVLPMSNVKVQETAHPSKIFEYLACGKPVVCCATGELRKLITDSQIGIVVEPSDPKALAVAILNLYKDELKREILGKRARKFVCKDFSYQAITSKWKVLIERYSKATNANECANAMSAL